VTAAVTTRALRPAALSILREGRLRLLDVRTDADQSYRLVKVAGRVAGHHGTYVVDYLRDESPEWTCTCTPWLRGGRWPCAHIVATQLVTKETA
jgi:predicted nucleic acid-binding Zn finger protein